MNRRVVLLSSFGGLLGGLAIGVIGMTLFHPSPKSPYVDQTKSPVKGLSAQEIDDLLNGRGAHLSKR